ncbi:MAG: GNAT family N-acetyltransferase [Clostridia bacterium]|nr:GNAT family N-acetyltransferase [Clostridia bacterium]
MNTAIRKAETADREAILALYRSQIGREFCPWNEDYPGPEEVDRDLAGGDLFVMTEESGRIIGAISREHDETVDALPCWAKELQPGGEFARLAVAPDRQCRGYARVMVEYMLDLLRSQGCRSVHILVNELNLKAIRSYAVFGFRVAGRCEMYEQPFLCYEKEL